MKKYIIGLILALSTNMAWAYTTTPRMGLTAPATGQFDYPDQFDRMFNIIDSSTAIQNYPNTFTSSNTFTGAASTVTVNNRLTLPYVSNNLCLSQTSNGVIGVACSGGGSPGSLGVTNGSQTNPGPEISTPTYNLNFASATMSVSLQGAATAFISLSPSSVTLQGNTFNGNNQLTKTDSAGHLPVSVFSSGVILSTESLQSGNTFYVSSGTALMFNASTATVYTLLQVLGNGATNQDVVGQINGAAFNVLKNGQIGLGTAVPGMNYALDEQLGTANFAYGINSTTITVSSVTVNPGGRITFPDGTVQYTAAISGTSNIAISTGSAAFGTVVSSPTAEVVFDSNTFIGVLQGPATSFISLNSSSVTLQGNNLSATFLTNSSATATYLQLSSATATYLNQITAAATYLTQSSATATYLQQSSATATYLAQSSATATYLQLSSATATYLMQSSATATYGQLAGVNTWTRQNNWTTPAVSSFTYGVNIGSLTMVTAGGGSGVISSGNWQGTVVATLYGGTSNDLSGAKKGAMPYFNANGVMGFTSSGTVNQLLQSFGTDSPVWVSSITISTLAVTGVSTLGTVQSGTWNGTAIATQFGGTGANLTGVAAGGIPYFTGNGGPFGGITAGTTGQILATAGSFGTPFWISSGTFIINQATLQSGATFFVSSGTAVTLYSTTFTATHDLGSVDGSDALVGDKGFFFSTCTVASNAGTTAQYFDTVSYAIPAGDWDVAIQANSRLNGSTEANGADFAIGLSSTSGNSSAGLIYGQTLIGMSRLEEAGSIMDQTSAAIPRIRVNQTSTITYYLKTYAEYTGGTPIWDGCITGRRMR